MNTNDTVISNLKKRSEEKICGINNSNLKTCLIVQGGGMRASYSMGCLQALEELGFSDSFDYVIGSSAGAINGAYFIAKQSKIATKVYADYLTNNKFINFFRLKKILDVSYLIKVFSSGETELKKETVINSPTELIFTMVHYPEAKECIISIKDRPFELMNLIKASATIPALSNEKITIGEDKYIDGAIVNPIPFKYAIEFGCTDIVVILTRSRNFKRKPLKIVYDMLSFSYFRDWPKKAKDSIFQRFSEVNELYNFVWSHEGNNKTYRILIISPENDCLAGLVSKSKKNILKNIQKGFNDTVKTFNKVKM